MPVWNPWHGCHKISPGCQNCYVYRMDARYGKDSSMVTKTSNFTLPLKRKRSGEYKLYGNEIVYTCFTSDFFVDDADDWRPEVWEIMRARRDLHFLIVTKRIHRFHIGLPDDWGNGYENVTICCTVENQDMADFRLPIYLNLPICHKIIICEPLLEAIDLLPYLTDEIEEVSVGGESGSKARVCKYEWILDIRKQCLHFEIPFTFRQTGALFEKDGKVYRIPRKFQHKQAKKANLNTFFE